MPVPLFPPKKDSELLSWSANWDAKITATPVLFGLTAAQATSYASLHAGFAARYAASVNPNTNSRAAINAKNVARETLLNGAGGAWELVDIVQAFPGTTDIMRGELGLRIPDVSPTPVPPPGDPPDLSIISTAGRTIKVRLRDQQNPDRRGKPAGVQGATILYFPGDVAPQDPSEWTFAMNTSRTQEDVSIPASVPAGTKVWLTAFWFNARKQTSQAATFESTRISDGLAQAA